MKFESNAWLRNVDLGIIGVNIIYIEKLSSGSVKNKEQWKLKAGLGEDVPTLE